MQWNFHKILVHGTTNHTMIENRWRETFGSLPAADGVPDIRFSLDMTDRIPEAPRSGADFSQGDLLQYFIDGQRVTAHFPRYGQLILDFEKNTIRGQILRVALDQYGVFEDLLAIGLSPLLKRRGMYLVHAFAAAYKEHGVLIVGSMGAGKTTTGMSLLNNGWRLLSNDSPILTDDGEVLQYPGVLAAYPETFARFPSTKEFSAPEGGSKSREKIIVPAEKIWPDVWQGCASVSVILFPKIESRPNHALEPLSAPEALRTLLPHAVEQWDKAMIPGHLAVLGKIVQGARAFILRLGPDVLAIPGFLEKNLFG